MNSAKTVEVLVSEWKAAGISKPDLVVNAANACIGWPYVWGANAQQCTTANRKTCMASPNIGAKDKQNIIDRCPILSGKSAGCSGCKYYPNNERVWIMDCRAFTRKMLAFAGITISGGGATSQWNTKSNWAETGTIDTMPKDKVCIVFKYAPSIDKMDHTLIYDGQGNYIHCSGEVKKQSISSYKATHWAIPKGLYDGVPAVPDKPEEPVPAPTVVLLRKGSKGEEVKRLQTLLIMRGYDLGSYGADGDFGNKTLEAVKKFQKDNGLAVDGIVGVNTWAALENDPPKQELYTLTLMHLTKSVVEELTARYGGVVSKE